MPFGLGCPKSPFLSFLFCPIFGPDNKESQFSLSGQRKSCQPKIVISESKLLCRFSIQSGN